MTFTSSHVADDGRLPIQLKASARMGFRVDKANHNNPEVQKQSMVLGLEDLAEQCKCWVQAFPTRLLGREKTKL